MIILDFIKNLEALPACLEPKGQPEGGWLMRCPGCSSYHEGGSLLALNQIGPDIIARCYGGCEDSDLVASLGLAGGAAPLMGARQWLERESSRGHERAYLQGMLARLLPLPPEFRAAARPKSGPIVHCMADIKPEKVVWLFENRVPRKNITLLVGDPGTGKSTFTIDLAARVTTGRGLPGEPEREPENVVYMTWEDGLADTVRPRLEAAGADLQRVQAISGAHEGEDERGLSFPQDLGYLESVVRKNNAALVIIDPLMAFLSSKVDSHKDQEIRRVMGGLARIAASTGAAILIVNHMNKASGGPALYRGAGSIGIIGSARSALLFAKDPEDKGETGLRILAPLKSNLGPAPTSLRLQVAGASNGSSMIRFVGNTTQTADGLTSAPLPDEERSMVDSAVDVLRQILADGKVRSGDVAKQAKEQGMSERTIWRAKTRLGVVCTKEGAGAWYWSIPSPDGRVGRVGSLPVKTDTYNSANNSANEGELGRVPEELGRVPEIDSPPNSANSANSANPSSSLGRVSNTINNYTFLNSANSANREEVKEAKSVLVVDEHQNLSGVNETVVGGGCHNLE